MKRWKVKLPGGRIFELESDNPSQELIDQGHTALALEQIFETPPAWKIAPNGEASAPLWLTVKQAAQLLQLSEDVVYRLTHRADFPATRVGHAIRINRRALEEWVAPTRAAGCSCDRKRKRRPGVAAPERRRRNRVFPNTVPPPL